MSIHATAPPLHGHPMPASAVCFAACAAPLSGRASLRGGSLCARRAAPRAAGRARARAPSRMAADDGQSQGDNEARTPTEQEVEEPKWSVWGVASFAIITLIFGATIVATLSRDFLPGGMSDPL